MSSGTQYMLQKNSCTRFAFCFCIWYPGSHNRTKRVWNNVKKFQLKTDAALLDWRNLSSHNAAVPCDLSCSRLSQTLQEHSKTQADAKS